MQARNCLPLFFLGFPAHEIGFSLDTLSLGFRATSESRASHWCVWCPSHGLQGMATLNHRLKAFITCSWSHGRGRRSQQLTLDPKTNISTSVSSKSSGLRRLGIQSTWG